MVHVVSATDDPGSGVATIYLDVFTTPEGVPTTPRDSLAIPIEPGTYYFRYYAADHVGNQGAIHTDTTVVYEAPSLLLSITDGLESAQPGDVLTYLITYENNGTAPATGVTLVDTLPQYTELVSTTAGGYEQIAPNVMRWRVGELTPGARGEDTVMVRVADRDHFPGQSLTLRFVVHITCEEGYEANTYDQTLVEGVPLTLGLQVEPKLVNLGQSVQLELSWNRALDWGEVNIQPEGDKLQFTPGPSQSDTTLSYTPQLEGEHQVVFTARDLLGGEAQAQVGFVVRVEEYFQVDRNRALEGGVVHIRFSLRRSRPVKVQVYNVAGELVLELFKGQAPAGETQLEWDGKDVNSGLYLIAFEGGQFIVKKILVIR